MTSSALHSYAGPALSPKAHSFLDLIKRHGCRPVVSGASNKTIRIYFAARNLGYINGTVIARGAVMGYRFNDSGAGSDSCPPGMERTLAKRFCSTYQCHPDDIEVREGGGNNAGRHFLLIRNPEAALRALHLDSGNPSSDELVVVSSGERYVEGRLINVEMQRRERSPHARQACLSAHGFTCFACGTNIKNRYRGLPVEVIHVHHEEPLSEAKGEREFDPVASMKPLCPNCHCVVHSKVPPYSVDEIRAMLYE